MYNNGTRISFRICLAFCIFVWISATLGCRQDPPDISIHESDQPVVNFKGFNIPKFRTALEQLNYARSGFPDTDEKRAAFEFVLRHFPRNQAECGEAVLNIAFMNFGFDYRFALLQDYYKAIEEYQDITKYYADQPTVMAKAYWYLGWIYCDLLEQKEKGLPYYWQIIREYPDIRMGITSPVPWVSLVYLDTPDSDKPAFPKIKPKWAGLALLEIIRHSPDPAEVRHAFKLIWNTDRQSPATGNAIKLILDDPSHAEFIRSYAIKYLALNVANPFLSNDIKTALKGGKNG